MKYFFVLLFLFLLPPVCGQPSETYEVRCIAFYNTENLYDTVRDSTIWDQDRTPTGKYRWTETRFYHKLDQLSRVIRSLNHGRGPDILALAEIENASVLHSLISTEELQDRNYGFIHRDSPDERGIDVALLYREGIFFPEHVQHHSVELISYNGLRDRTRDVLTVSGYLNDERIALVVVHWPSRSGGQSRSAPLRMELGRHTLQIADSILRSDPGIKLMVLGDFNDDPEDLSIKKVLRTTGKQHFNTNEYFYNPMEALHRRGYGSLAYRDHWHFFDQILLHRNLIKAQEGYRYWQSGVFNPSWLLQPFGRYRGYPLRSFTGTIYNGGFSDHLPVYITLIRPWNP